MPTEQGSSKNSGRWSFSLEPFQTSLYVVSSFGWSWFVSFTIKLQLAMQCLPEFRVIPVNYRTWGAVGTPALVASQRRWWPRTRWACCGWLGWRQSCVGWCPDLWRPCELQVVNARLHCRGKVRALLYNIQTTTVGSQFKTADYLTRSFGTSWSQASVWQWSLLAGAMPVFYSLSCYRWKSQSCVIRSGSQILLLKVGEKWRERAFDSGLSARVSDVSRPALIPT